MTRDVADDEWERARGAAGRTAEVLRRHLAELDAPATAGQLSAGQIDAGGAIAAGALAAAERVRVLLNAGSSTDTDCD